MSLPTENSTPLLILFLIILATEKRQNRFQSTDHLTGLSSVFCPLSSEGGAESSNRKAIE